MNLNPIAGIIEAVGSVAGELVTTDKERLAADIEMQKLGIEAQKIEASLIAGQIDVNKVEAASSSLFVAGWRPACGWIGAAAMAYQFLLYPLLVWAWALLQAHAVVPATLSPPPMLNTDALWVILTGMLGIAGARTVEKIKGVTR